MHGRSKDTAPAFDNTCLILTLLWYQLLFTFTLLLPPTHLHLLRGYCLPHLTHLEIPQLTATERWIGWKALALNAIIHKYLRYWTLGTYTLRPGLLPLEAGRMNRNQFDLQLLTPTFRQPLLDRIEDRLAALSYSLLAFTGGPFHTLCPSVAMPGVIDRCWCRALGGSCRARSICLLLYYYC